MRSILRLWLPVLFFAVMKTAQAAAPDVPSHITYNEASEELNAQARASATAAFAADAQIQATVDLFDDVLLIGPVLWQAVAEQDPTLKTDVFLSNKIPWANAFGEYDRTVDVDAGCLKNTSTKSQFVQAMRARFPFPDEMKIRPLNAEELEIYWLLISFDIDEPIFVMEFESANVMLHFNSTKDMRVLYIEVMEPDTFNAMVEESLAKSDAEIQQKADEFIAQTVETFGDRETATKAFVQKGHQLLKSGQLEEAERMFQQAQILGPEEATAYSGQGLAIFYQIGSGTREPTEMYKCVLLQQRGHELDPENPRILGDLGYALVNVARMMKEGENKTKLCNQSIEMFEKAIAIEPEFGLYYKLWSFPLFEQGKYAEAWEKIQKAREMGVEIEPSLQARLEEKMPDPYAAPGVLRLR